jgi:hypothetical protein
MGIMIGFRCVGNLGKGGKKEEEEYGSVVGGF